MKWFIEFGGTMNMKLAVARIGVLLSLWLLVGIANSAADQKIEITKQDRCPVCGMAIIQPFGEPVYHYDDPGCEAFITEAVRLGLPVVLEESFQNTLYFIKRIAGRIPIIIPHLGGLNGGFPALLESGIWDGETVYADTALASTGEIETFLKRYGSEKLLFGSDFPFGIPSSELSKVRRLGLKDEDFENVVNRNILRLIQQEA